MAYLEPYKKRCMPTISKMEEEVAVYQLECTYAAREMTKPTTLQVAVMRICK